MTPLGIVYRLGVHSSMNRHNANVHVSSKTIPSSLQDPPMPSSSHYPSRVIPNGSQLLSHAK